MSSFLYKKIWHGISIHTRKCIPVKEKFTDVYFVLDEAVLEYLKSYQIYTYLTDNGSTVIFKPSKDR